MSAGVVLLVWLPAQQVMGIARVLSTFASLFGFALLARELLRKQWRGVALAWTCGFAPLGLLSVVYLGVHTGVLPAEGWVIESVSLAGVLDVAFNSMGFAFYLAALRARQVQREVGVAETAHADAVQIEVLRAKIALALRAGGLTRSGCAVLVMRPVAQARKPSVNMGRYMNHGSIVMAAAMAAARWGDSITRINSRDFAMLLGGTNDEEQTRLVAQQVVANVRQAIQADPNNPLRGVHVAFALITHRSPRLDARQWLERLSTLLASANGGVPRSAVLCLHNGLAFGEAGISLARTARDAA